MADVTASPPARPIRDSGGTTLGRRHRREGILKAAGLTAILLAVGMLLLMLGALALSGYQAFTQTHATIDVPLEPDLIDAGNPAAANWRTVMRRAGEATLPGADAETLRTFRDILSDGAQYAVRDRVVADPSLIGTTLRIAVPLSDPYDQLHKGLVDRATPEANRRVSDAEIAVYDRLAADGRVGARFNWALFSAADSRFPELAGLRGALVGSFYTLAICFALAFPIGIGAAIYLEEFAPKNRVSDFIEVNINNLAAVPSVVFGLLALSVFINWFGLPRSAPFVGGLTLALMVMPTIIIATRASLKAVPPSIREAALGVGASPQQVVFQHVLPLAMPGIMTGTIIGMAHALGETAPLLLIGMNAFITAAPATPFDSATTLPTQIFIWADSPERGFVSRTSAAILVLLGVLLAMNALAIWLRSRFERRW